MYPLPEGCFAPRNQWYIAAWSEEIRREPIERWILNEPVAFYRKENGDAVAVGGRCPHRSFPLGRSRVVGDNLQCGYHGITFRPDGICARIPTQAGTPPSLSVKSYPLVEQWRWLWIWMGDNKLADTYLIPSLESLGLHDGIHLMSSGGYNFVKGRYMLLHDNLLDLTHFGHLHRPSLGGGPDAQDTIPQVKYGDDWISTEYIQRNVAMPNSAAAMIGYTGQVDRFQGLKLYLPCLHVGGGSFHHPSAQANVAGGCIGSIRVYHGVTPATHHTTHYFFASGQSWSRDMAVSRDIHDRTMRSVITEDIMAAECIEEMARRLDGRLSEVMLIADKACARGRRLFEKMIAAERIAAAPEQMSPAGPS